MVEVYRAIRVHERKIKKAEAKKNKERANKLRERMPKPKLDRNILERFIFSFNQSLFIAAGNEFAAYLIILEILGTQDLWMHSENWMTAFQWCIFLLLYLHQRAKKLKWNASIIVGGIFVKIYYSYVKRILVFGYLLLGNNNLRS